MRTFIVSIIMLFVFCFGVLPKAQALDPTPVGKWDLLIYLEPNLAKVGPFSICFLSNGTCFFVGGGGHGDWFQKGDRIRFYGPISNTRAIAAFGQFNSNLGFAGEFTDFHLGPSPVTIRIGNFIVSNKVSATCQ